MEIRKLFKISEEDISKNNIMVPICIWNKFFLDDTKPTKNIAEYIKRALEKTKEGLSTAKSKIKDWYEGWK